MNRVMIEEVKRISNEMIAIVNRSEQEGRKMKEEELETLDQLQKAREELLGNIIYHGYGE